MGLGATLVFLLVVPRSYPVGEWLFWRFALIWAYALAFAASALCLGHFVLERVFRVREEPLLESLLFACPLGVVAYGLVFYAFGAFGALGPAFPFVYTALCVVLGARGLFARARRGRGVAEGAASSGEPAQRSAAEVEPPAVAPPGALERGVAVAASAAGVVALAVVYLGIMTPDAIGYDASWQHQVIAQEYGRNGRIVPFPADWAKNHPQLAAIVSAWAYLVPGLIEPERWVLALHLEFVLFVLTLVAVGTAVGLLVERRVRAAWTGFFLFPAIFVYDCNLQGSADHVLAFFTLPVFVAAVRAGRSLASRDLALVGALTGGAVLVKYQAMYLGAAAAVPLVLGWLCAGRARLRRQEGALSWRRLAGAPFFTALVALAVCSPHFVRNWVFYDNPFYPYLQHVIPSRPTLENPDFYVHYTYLDPSLKPSGPFLDRVRDVASTMVTFSWIPHYMFWSRHVPVFGSLFTLCTPLALLLPRPRARVWLALAAAIIGLWLWAATYRTDRNLQALVPLFAAVTTAVLVLAWRLGPLARIGIVPLVLVQLAWQSDSISITQSGQLSRALEFVRAGYDGRRGIEAWRGFRQAHRDIDAALPPDAVVVMHYHHLSLGIRRTLHHDWTGMQALFDNRGLSSPRELWQAYRDQGVTHLISLPGGMAAVTRGEDVLFAALLLESKSSQRFGPFRLDELPKKPPSARPLDVLALGLAGYADGLYPVERLSVHEGTRSRRLVFPEPLEALPDDDEGRRALVARADAVFVGPRGVPERQWSPPLVAGSLRALVDQRFRRAASFAGGLELYFRKPGPRRLPGPVAVP